jgi:hypothetical protein
MNGPGHIELTRFAKSGGPLSKRISLGPDGQMISDGSACIMTRGTARRVTLSNLSDLAALIADLDTHEALGLGTLHPSTPDAVEVTTKRKLIGARQTCAHRSHQRLYFLPSRSTCPMPYRL